MVWVTGIFFQDAARDSSLYVFQRTAPWVFPKPSREISNVEKWLNKRTSVLQNMERLSVDKVMLVVNYGLLHPWLMRAFEPAAKAMLRHSIPDKKLRKQVTPDFTIGCKRVLFSNNYYPALRKPNVELLPEAVKMLDKSVIVSATGERRELHSMIYRMLFSWLALIYWYIPLSLGFLSGKPIILSML